MIFGGTVGRSVDAGLRELFVEQVVARYAPVNRRPSSISVGPDVR
jgi:hypothetical protein